MKKVFNFNLSMHFPTNKNTEVFYKTDRKTNKQSLQSESRIQMTKKNCAIYTIFKFL